jgi:hypothetical protein
MGSVVDGKSTRTPFDEEHPCEICGKFGEDCICPPCEVCGICGCLNHKKRREI